MKTNHKITVILTVMLLSLLVATLINIAINFRSSALNNATDKAKTTAEIIKDGLTAHMVNGIMDKRQFFLDQITSQQSIRKLWIVRSPAVDKQFGKGFINEYARDEIDKEVLQSGKTVKYVQESSDDVHLRITIPYSASVDGKPNCLSCHNVPTNTVLGAISMELDINDIRNAGTFTILKILAFNLIFIIIAVYVTNIYFKPFIKFFETLREGVEEAYKGNFNYHFKTTLKGEGEEVISQLNHLFMKMHQTFGGIKENLATFLTQSKLSCDDPLNDANIIIKELSDVYKFKKTIELDSTKESIYGRITYILRKKFDIKEFSLYEIHKEKNLRQEIFSNITTQRCFLPESEINGCRAYRTNFKVISTDFPDLCQYCQSKDREYICVPITINENIALILTIYAQNKSELDQINFRINSITNYFETAKPVIESRILMAQLRDTALRDGMTGLYNRRFLEEFIDKVMSQTLREENSYAVLMIDIDYFKLVNDEYGHDAGDTVITGLAKIMLANIRQSDLAIRYGGEEFVLLLHNATLEGAQAVAQKIKETFNATIFDINDNKIQKTLSIGISHFPTHANSIWKCIKYADMALYEAKNSGRNKIVIYNEAMFSYDEEERQS